MLGLKIYVFGTLGLLTDGCFFDEFSCCFRLTAAPAQNDLPKLLSADKFVSRSVQRLYAE